MEFSPEQPELSPASSTSSPVVALQAQISMLQMLLLVLLVALLIMCASFAAFMRSQTKMVSAQADALAAQHAKTMEEVQKGFQPAASQLISQLIGFARQYPDFLPILTRNGINPPAAAAPAQSLPTPTPPGAPKKK